MERDRGEYPEDNISNNGNFTIEKALENANEILFSIGGRYATSAFNEGVPLFHVLNRLDIAKAEDEPKKVEEFVELVQNYELIPTDKREGGNSEIIIASREDALLTAGIYAVSKKVYQGENKIDYVWLEKVLDKARKGLPTELSKKVPFLEFEAEEEVEILEGNRSIETISDSNLRTYAQEMEELYKYPHGEPVKAKEIIDKFAYNPAGERLNIQQLVEPLQKKGLITVARKKGVILLSRDEAELVLFVHKEKQCSEYTDLNPNQRVKAAIKGLREKLGDYYLAEKIKDLNSQLAS